MSNYLSMIKGISEAEHIKHTIIMGKPGSGKTTISGTFPKPMLYISIGRDGGGEVLKCYKDTEIKFIQLENDVVGKSPKPTSVYNKVMDLLTELSINNPFKTVVIDAYTSIQESLIKFIEAQKGKLLNQQEYGAVGKLMLDMRDKIDSLAVKECEYVSICHIKENEQTDSITGETTKELVPKMTLNNGKILLEHASAVLYTCKKTVLDSENHGVVKFLTYVGAHPNIDTKFRTKGNKDNIAVGRYYEDFTYEKMKDLYDGKVKMIDEKTVKVLEPTGNPFEDLNKND